MRAGDTPCRPPTVDDEDAPDGCCDILLYVHTRLTVVRNGRARLLVATGEGDWAALARATDLPAPAGGWWITPWPGAPARALQPTDRLGTFPILDGATVHPCGPEEDDPVRAPVRLVVTAGPDTGRWVDLRPGEAIGIGRDRDVTLRLGDPMLSRRHATVTTERGGVQLRDTGSTNGTWLGDDLVTGSTPWPPGTAARMGGSWLELVEAPARAHGGPRPGDRRVLRPDRSPTLPLADVELRTPEPSSPAPPGRMPVLSWALPLTVSVVLAAVLRMPYLLLFGLMAPAMSLGSHVSDRRKHRRDVAAAAAQHAAATRRTRQLADQALHDEAVTRSRRVPGVGHLGASLQTGVPTGLWSRPAGHPVHVRLGLADLPARVSLDGVPLRVRAAPIEVDLSNGLRLVGAAPLVRGLARSLVCQAALLHGPDVLGLELTCEPEAGRDWDWITWLPHHRGAAPVLLRITESKTQDGTQVVVCAPDSERDDLRSVVVHSPAVVTVTCPESEALTGTPDIVPPGVATAIARSLTSLRADAGAQPTAPADLDFRDLHPPPHAGTIAELWRRSPRTTRFSAGTTTEGPMTLDLAVDGPHVLVGGTTGSGKSELLRSLVASLAVGNRPDELGFVLVDYKGGASFGDAALLPHTRALVTDLDPHLADRALRSLTAELKRRERLLADAGVRDLTAYQRLPSHPVLPRLVLVIDEFRALAQELPAFLEGLVRVAALGRSLGVHLVLATQRPAGIVSADIRANVNLRIALRVRDEGDSRDVIDAPDAAHLPERVPGRALVRTGSDRSRPLRVASVTYARSRTATGPQARWVDSPWEAATAGGGDLAAADPAEEGGYLRELVEATRDASAVLDCAPVPPPWLPTLPDVVTLSALPPGAMSARDDTVRLPVGMVDLPEEQRQPLLTWSPLEEGNLLVVGSPRSGRSTAARTAVTALLEGFGPLVQLYGFDPAGALSPLADLAATAAWVGPDETARGARVVEVLGGLLEERRRHLSAGGWTGIGEQHRSGRTPLPVVCLVLDDWAALTGSYGEADRGRVMDRLHHVLRDGPTVGIVAVVTGDRSILTSRLTSTAGQTWCLHMADPDDLLLTGLRRHQVPGRMPPGRLVRTSDGAVAQLAVVGAAPDGASQLRHLTEIVQRHKDELEGAVTSPASPFRPVRRLPDWVPLDRLPSPVRGDGSGDGSRDDLLFMGLGGDSVLPVGLPLGAGGLFLVAGPPASGRTTALNTMAVQAGRLGMRVLRLDGPSGGRPRGGGPGPLLGDPVPSSMDEPVCVVVDDVGDLADTPAEDELLAWARTGPAGGGMLVVAGETERLAATFRGIVPVVTRARTGLLLQPRGPADGALLGADVPVADAMIPGRGLLVVRGRTTRVQVAVPE